MARDTKNQRIISIRSLKLYFEKAVTKKTDESAKDVARVLTLFVLATLFCPNTGSRITWSFLDYIVNLEESKSYAWSKFITDELIKDLETKAPNNVEGCSLGLLFWLCEHTKLANISEPSDFPRFRRWKLSDLNESLKNTPLQTLESDEVSDSHLEPTRQERDLLEIIDFQGNEENKSECGNLQLQTEIEILRSENKKLIEDNQRKDQEIAELQEKLHKLENDNAKYGFQCESVQLEKKRLMQEKKKLDKDWAKDFGTMLLQNDLSTEEKEQLQKQNVGLEVEVVTMVVNNEIIHEKLEEALDTIDDIEAHKVSQEYQENRTVGDNEEEEKDEVGEPNEKENQQEENDATVPDHKMVGDEELQRTITAACKEIEPQQGQKKRILRSKVQIDPSSLTKRVTERDTRLEKRIEGYVYTDDEKKKNTEHDKKKKRKPRWRPEKSKLYHLLQQEDKDILDQICDCEELDEAIAVWTNKPSAETVPLFDIIRLLEQGDVSNAVIDGFLNILDREQEAQGAKNENIAYFTCMCWSQKVSPRPEHSKGL